MIEDIHLKAPFRPASDGFPDAAHTDDSQLLVMDVQAEQILVVAALPLSILHIAIEFGNTAGRS
ncbi:hypothetical protein D3C77_592030 [compost metagenome]